MDASNSSSMMRLSASSTYDDQGLRATLLLGLALLVVLLPPVLYLTSTNVLWIKRLYRTNHTVEPTAPHIHANRSTATTAAAAAATDFPSAMDDPSAQALNEVDAEWWKLYSSSPVASTEHLVRSTGGDGQSRSVVRRKRLGISLPVSSTLLSPPSWSDLCSVEEEIAVRHGVYLSGVVEGEGQEASPSSPSRHVRSYGSIAASNSSTTNNNNSGTLQSAAVHADTTSAASFSACGSPQSPAPRTFHDRPPLDPQVSLYLFSLKYFAAVMLLGSLFTMWIPFLTAGDDYFEAYQVRRDARRCHAQDLNESGCNQLRPYCEFRNSTMFDGGVVELLSSCHPVPLRGLYDLTVQNVRPRSWRWWPIAILNVGFATVCALLTVWAVRKVDVFIAAAMKRQLQSALGYRVVCVRGLQQSSSGEGALSATHFIERYLNVATYFGPSAAAADGDGGVGPSTTTSTQHYYEELYCSGLDCIFSILNCVHSIFEPADAVFAEPQRVREVLVTRHPPRGIYRSIRRAEKATLALQEAIAEDKALKRRWRAGGASPHIIHNGNNNHDEVEEAESEGDIVVPSHGDRSSSGGTDGSEAVYMVRGPCPSCCICCPAVPAVPLREAAYRAAAADLNKRISQVAHQRTAGGIFVIFSDCLAAFEFAGLFEAARRFHGGGAFSRASIAGPPSRIIENNLHTNRLWLTLRLVAVLLVFIVLLFTWSIPVGFLGSLDSLAYVLGPRAEHLVENPFMRNLITAYLPVLVLALFNLALPVIIRALVIAMGAWNKTECDGGHLYLQYLFMVLTGVVFQAALQGGLAQLEDLVVQPNHDGIINFFVACVTPQGGYWYAKVVMALCLSAWLDLLDPIGFLKAFLLRQRARTQRQYAALFAPCKFEYPKQYSFDLTILSMGLLFHMTVPILGLLVGAYGVVRYYTQRAKLMDRYRSTLATAQECSDFGVTAQVMRSVAWLWVLSDTGNLLLVSLHGRSGAMVLNSLSLSIALIVLCYVHLVSRRWVASLNNVRRIFPDGLPVAAATRQGSSSFCGGEREEGGGRRQHSSHNHDEDEEEEEGIMDAYESASMFALEEDARQQGSCPFWQRHVLPRRPGTSSRYRPKHQRLAIIDVEAEVQRMHDAKFPVQRFWDRSMTWFEEDHHE